MEGKGGREERADHALCGAHNLSSFLYQARYTHSLMLSLKFFSSSPCPSLPTTRSLGQSSLSSGPAPTAQSSFPSTRLSEKGPPLGPRHRAHCLPRVGVMVGVGRVAGEEQSPDSILAAPPPPPISFLPSTFWLPLPAPSFSFSPQSGEGMGCPLPKSRPPCGSHWSHQHKVNIKKPLALHQAPCRVLA